MSRSALWSVALAITVAVLVAVVLVHRNADAPSTPRDRRHYHANGGASMKPPSSAQLKRTLMEQAAARRDAADMTTVRRVAGWLSAGVVHCTVPGVPVDEPIRLEFAPMDVRDGFPIRQRPQRDDDRFTFYVAPGSVRARLVAEFAGEWEIEWSPAEAGDDEECTWQSGRQALARVVGRVHSDCPVHRVIGCGAEAKPSADGRFEMMGVRREPCVIRVEGRDEQGIMALGGLAFVEPSAHSVEEIVIDVDCREAVRVTARPRTDSCDGFLLSSLEQAANFDRIKDSQAESTIEEEHRQLLSISWRTSYDAVRLLCSEKQLQVLDAVQQEIGIGDGP